MERTPIVLLVQSDPGERLVLGDWLEDAGYVVSTCPGPTAPAYTCIGSREGRCPLATEADVIVLDMRLAGDIAMEGTPAWHLLTYYAALDTPIVALVGEDDAVRPRPDDQVQIIARAPTFSELRDAVRRALTSAAAEGVR